ncbi:hypothetical protein Tco_0038147 [Tanacetum coccineum]
MESIDLLSVNFVGGNVNIDTSKVTLVKFWRDSIVLGPKSFRLEADPLGVKFLLGSSPIYFREASFDIGSDTVSLFPLLFDVEDYRNNSKGSVTNFKEELRILDELIDKGILSALSKLKRSKGRCGLADQTNPPGQMVSHLDLSNTFGRRIENAVFETINVLFFTCGEIPKRCNSTFIALIPKNPDANMVKDFRPISLIGSIYKIIAKILTNRLVDVLGGNILHISFQRVVDVGMFTGIKLSSSLNISHLFYADDAIFLGQWNDSNIDTLVHVMECFLSVSVFDNLCKARLWEFHVTLNRIKSRLQNLGALFSYTFPLFSTKVGEICKSARMKEWKNQDEMETILVFERQSIEKAFRKDVFPRCSVWSLEKSGGFSVKSIRQVMMLKCFPVIHSAQGCKSVHLR